MAEPTDSSDQDAAPDDEAMPGEKTMGFLDHLEELRWTIIKSLVAFIIAAVIVGVFFDQTVHVLDRPLDHALAGKPPEGFQRVTNSVMGIFNVYIQVGFLGALSLSFPFILYFVVSFVAPALTPKEKRLLVPVCFAVFCLFVAGGAFSYFILAPQAIEMSLAANRQFGATLMLGLDNYYSMLVWLIVGMGAICQFPVVIQILVYLDIVSVQRFRSMRRLMILVCFIAAAVITPTPDPINMSICALPLWVLYEIALIVAVGVEKRRNARR